MSAVASSQIPLPVSSFVGRENERAELVELMATERLITLVGPPGVGKTRLAIEVARAMASLYPDGAHWVDLALVDDPKAVVATLARALGIPQQAGAPALDTIVAALIGRPRLVVLDNCEHLVAEVAVVVQLLLERVGNLKVLATSRQALDIVGERPWPVDTLPVPPPDATPEQVSGSPAGELFCTRAATVNPHFALDATTSPVMAHICRRLDGIPLAIELAAARTTVLSLEQIASGLEGRFRLLGRAQRSVDGRHQTLAEALEWSYELLSPPERALMRRLGVFVGEFDLPAIQTACVDGEVTEANVLDLASSLVAKSLVVARTDVNPARYRLLETLREFATDRLSASGEGPSVATRWAEWYLHVVHHAEAQLTGPDQVAWLTTLDVHYPNIWATLRWALAAGGTGALVLASKLTLYWRLRGLFAEGRDSLEAALAACPNAEPAKRAKAMWGAGFLALMKGDATEAELLLLESAELYGSLGDVGGEGRALMLVGNARHTAQGAPSALSALEASIALATEVGDAWCLAHGLALLGETRLDLGDSKSARAMFSRGLDVATEAGDLQGQRLAITLLGDLDMIQGDYVQARSRLESALALTQALAEPYGSGAVLAALGDLAAREAEWETAWSYLAEALRIDQSSGAGRLVAQHLCALGRVELEMFQLDRAGFLFERSLDHLSDYETADAILGLAEVRLAEGRLADGRALLGRLDSLDPASNSWRTRADLLVALAALDRADGKLGSATKRMCEALDLRVTVGDAPGTTESLESLAGISVQAGNPLRATKLLAAAESRLSTAGHRRSLRRKHDCAGDLAVVRTQLSAEAFEAAWAQGTAMSERRALTFALRVRGDRGPRLTDGWDSLTGAERDVVALAAEGLSNPLIAERLMVTRNTVKFHLSNAFAKLGVTSRVELAREAMRQSPAAT